MIGYCTCSFYMVLYFVLDVFLSDLTYKDIYIDGEIIGVQELKIGRGVNFLAGENVRIKMHCFSTFYLSLSFRGLLGQVFMVSD